MRIQSSAGGYTNLGIEIFFRYDVLFDIGTGQLGFRPQGT